MICKRGLLLLTCSFFLGTWAHAGVIYQNDFESQAVGTEWLGASLTTTPSGCARCTSFLGEFVNQAVVLRLLNFAVTYERHAGFRPLRHPVVGRQHRAVWRAGHFSSLG